MKYIGVMLVLLFSSINGHAQEKTEVIAQNQTNEQSTDTNKSTEKKSKKKKEKTNEDFRTDTVTFGLTASFVGASYFKDSPGLLSQTSLDIYAGTPKKPVYFYIGFDIVTPMIKPQPNNIFSGLLINSKLGIGGWVYKKLNFNQKGWIVGLNIAFLTGNYSRYAVKYGSIAWHESFGVGVTINMRTIYQLNRNFGFIIGADISYYYSFSFTTGLDQVHGLTGGLTTGIAF
ncbi:MAG: hypothetical protein ACRCTJ_00020 [Brevinema sp.]